MDLTIVVLTEIVAIVLAFLAEMIPGWSDWRYKRWTVFGVNMLVPVAIWLLQCPADVFQIFTLSCDINGVLGVAVLGFMAFMTSTGVYTMKILPDLPPDRKYG